MQLNGKTAIVTGASSGIGTEFSRALIAKGCHVFGLARRGDRLQQLADRLGELFTPVILDINDYEKVEKWVRNTFSASSGTKSPGSAGLGSPNASSPYSSPDILINNAGIGAFGAVDELSHEQWDMMIQTNLTAVFRLTRLIVPLMKQHAATTHIVNIASVAGLIGNPNISGYNASKFGLRGFSEALFKELREYRIKVTCIFPGSIATEFFDDHGGTHPNMMQGSDVANTLIHILETPDNFLIDEITLRPLIPKPPAK